MRKLVFKGARSDLEKMVSRYCRNGRWEWKRERKYFRFYGSGGEILNWWPSRGTVQIQGQNAERFRASLARQLSPAPNLTFGALNSDKGLETLSSRERSLVRRVRRLLADELGLSETSVVISIEGDA